MTSWGTFAGEGAGQQLTLKIYRPLGGGAYSVAAVDGPKPLVENQLNTFKVAIPVASGDVIGLEDTNASKVPTACAVITGNPGDVITSEEGDVPVGGTLSFGIEEPEVLANISATVLPPGRRRAQSRIGVDHRRHHRRDLRVNFAEERVCGQRRRDMPKM